ncbi:MAG: hypothetical protein AAF741_16805 [Bacteroidota bacterium]
MRQAVLIILFIYSLPLFAQQVQRIDQYEPGTKISYFMGQCGQSVPEAEGKLTFCDAVGNLGVVIESSGLNSDGVSEMLPNYFDDTELYITRNGLSMREADGKWNNLPNPAIPTLDFNSDFSNTSEVVTGFMDSNGLLHLIVFNNPSGYEYWLFDRTAYTFEEVDLPNFQAARQIAYDEQSGNTFIMGNSGGFQRIYERIACSTARFMMLVGE